MLFERHVQGPSASGCSPFASKPPAILLLPLEGVIASASSAVPRDRVAPARIKTILDTAARDRSIRAIILRINSPGGTVVDSDLILHLLKEYSKTSKVPIFAHIEGLGASGGYYIAVSAKNINASPTSMVGSIGVIVSGFGMAGLLEKLGIQYRTFQSGKRKDALSPFRTMREDEQEFIQKQIAAMYERFLAVILESRGDRLADAELRKAADGSVYLAKQALDLHLIDSVSYLDEYIETIKRSQEIPNARVITYTPSPGLSGNMYDVEVAERKDAFQETAESILRAGAPGVHYLWLPGMR